MTTDFIELPCSDDEDDDILISDEDVLLIDAVEAASCTCNAGSRAHKKCCPLNSRNRYSSLAVNIGSSSRGKQSGVSCVKVADSTTSSTSVEKRVGNHCTGVPTKKRNCNFVVGDYVCVHSNSLDKHHIPCRVVHSLGNLYRVCCQKGIIKCTFSRSELTSLDKDVNIPLHNWRVANKVSLSEVVADPICVEACSCTLSNCVTEITDLTQKCDPAMTTNDNWLCNSLYTLCFRNKDEVLLPSGWLSDSVIAAAQLLILQQFPHMSGLQTPVLQQSLAFQVHSGEFVQIVNIRNNHWCVISTVGCDEGVVNVYDSMYASLTSSTVRIIASLMYSSTSQLTIRMMDVGRQSNSSDCGVLAIAFAYDVCCGIDPCKRKYDHKSIRPHLAKGLPLKFPSVG